MENQPINSYLENQLKKQDDALNSNIFSMSQSVSSHHQTSSNINQRESIKNGVKGSLITKGEDIYITQELPNNGLFQKMVPLADLMQKMIQIEQSLPFIQRLEKIFDKQDEKMNNLSYKVQRFMSTPEIETKLDIFEQDLFQKLQIKLDRIENKMGNLIDAKANKVEVTDYIKHKANFTDLSRAQERILQLELQLNGLLESQDSSTAHVRETVQRLSKDLLATQNDLFRLAKADQIQDLELKLLQLENFMMENLASSVKNPVELSTDDERRQFKEKKHVNQHGYGEEYLKLIQRRYADKEPNQFPLKEKTSYLQVQNNEIGDKIVTHEQLTQHLINQQNQMKDELSTYSQTLLDSQKQVQSINSFISSQKENQRRIEDYFNQAATEHKTLQDQNKRIEDTLVNLKGEHFKLVGKWQRDHEDFAQKILRLEIRTETQQRELELLKSVRMQLVDKIENEVKSVRELRTKIDRKCNDYDDRIARLQIEFHKMKDHLEAEIDLLREPLAIEINKMRSENEQLHDAFENQKNDYRDLTGGFLKVLNQNFKQGVQQNQQPSDQETDEVKLKDKFLQKQVMMKSFYSEAQRIGSPFSTLQFQKDSSSNILLQADDKNNQNIVPLPDIPKIFLKAQNINNQNSSSIHSNGIQSARSVSTALTQLNSYQQQSNNNKKLQSFPKQQNYQPIKQHMFSPSGLSLSVVQTDQKSPSNIDGRQPPIYDNSNDGIAETEKDSMNMTGSTWINKKSNSTHQLQLLSPKSLTHRSQSQTGFTKQNQISDELKVGRKIEGNKGQQQQQLDVQKLKKFKHLMEGAQKIDEEDDYSYQAKFLKPRHIEGIEESSKSKSKTRTNQNTLLRNVILMTNQQSKLENKKLKINTDRPKTELGRF